VTSFERQCLGALKLAGAVMGEEEFTLSGLAGPFHGVYNEFTQEREFTDDGGRKTTCSCAIICSRDQFDGQQPKLGMIGTVFGHQKYRVVKLDNDAISYTFYFGNLND